MLGPAGPGETSIWLWLREAAALARVAVSSGVIVERRDLVTGAVRVGVDAIHPGSVIGLLRVAGAVGPTLALTLDGAAIGEVTVPSVPAPSSTGIVELVAGSCANLSDHSDAPVFRAMADAAPDLALLLGDNCYYVACGGLTYWWAPGRRDWGSATGMLRRQLDARRQAELQALARRAPCLAIWDDHDFGYNNAGGRDRWVPWAGRDVSAEVFRAMWPNPYAAPTGAIHHTYRYGPVELFMTDARFDKNPRMLEVWGAAQQAWLLAALRASTAPVKIVCVALQLLHQTRRESFKYNAPLERQALLDAILGVDAPPIPGRVLLLAGDAHHAQLVRWSADAYAPVCELTASPLRHPELGRIGGPGEADTRVWAVRADSFAHLRVDVTGATAAGLPTGTIAMRILDAAGAVLDDHDHGRPCSSVWDLATAALS